ncbi:2'-5' RNA ligase family protein [Pseudonocardia sp. TRM90224]|uniref:2'-5' RNA ligase family protein n=1 Tax=Pseudonocardia sp. TRM90224 TaxID=2812678 RepID=UPI001E4AD49B|nr:2'-5' RNA ligase family protein [Pseudonocardia sp. TRM90224]
MNAELSGLVVLVPAAEPLVGELRAELDAHAAWGVPAHVTVLVPFLDPAAIDDAVLAALREVVATVPAAEVTFERVEWFGDDLVWLAPEPSAPFAALTAAVSERFGLRPYGGVHEPVPHLTVAHDAPLPRLRAAADELAGGLPVRAAVTEVALIAGRREPESWTTVATFPLA